jgi:diguanylate cyclase (GGDEF)-like protein
VFKHSLKITSRFNVVLVVLFISLLAVASAGFYGLHQARSSLNSLYQDNVVNTQAVVDLSINLDAAHQLVLEYLLADTPADQQQLARELHSGVAPGVASSITEVTNLSGDNPIALARAQTIAASWGQFSRLWSSGQLVEGNLAERSSEATQVTSLLNTATADATQLVHIEGAAATEKYEAALTSYNSSLRLMEIFLFAGLIAGLGAVLWLIRSVLPRTLTYSRFAARIADGDFSQRLIPSGSDEIAQLGHTLDDVARRRQAEIEYDRTQLEYSDTLQVTERESEAHELLKRHLERSIDASRVTVLSRNNITDSLETVTAPAPESPFDHSQQGVSPSSCLAVRMARPHTEGNNNEPLLSCAICSSCRGSSICTPLLASGEVIGSVLVNGPAVFPSEDRRRIRESVSHAAPVLANLRNLAVAEQRASTDALTGLPNRRHLLDTSRRMAAQASRTKSPLSVLMLDLDHFKFINDRYGHGRGDEVLSAVGQVLRQTVRESDFAGRYGGEEFLVLLPATDERGARTMAERIRLAVRTITTPGLDRQVTVSIGIGALPEHAVDADGLERAADRALYLAKNNGRDRVEVATACLV